MNIREAFPSKYLQSHTLNGREVTVTISNISIEDFAQKGQKSDPKPVLYFRGKDMGFVLNKTNANTIASMYGDEMDNWIGKAITLFPTQTDFQGQQRACIRVKLFQQERAPFVRQAAAAAPPMPSAPLPDEFDDGPPPPSDADVPF